MKPYITSRLRLFARIIAAAGGLLALNAHAQAVTPVFTEDFATDRDGWYAASTGGGGIAYAPGALTLKATGTDSSNHFVTYFSSTNLEVGESLTVNFTYSVSGTTTATQFRFGLFNSGSSGQASRDGHGTSGRSLATPNGLSNGFNSYVGYRGSVSSSNLGLTERGTTESSTQWPHLLTGGSPSPWTTISTTGSTPSSLSLGSGQDFHVTFTFTRSAADTLSLSLNFTGIDSSGNTFNYTVTGSDSASIVSTFDTFAFSVNNSDVDLIMKSVEITGTGAIPEPAATAALVGALLLLAACVIRRKK
ncbi:hypothetical protein Ga0100231_016505 [Opitutaceae bacterium TAV4]|nr:hypothetical protein Ga0100231_016505 [Opitutaceae bacterium TAV4]RRK02178.1 hypothetical protein Ga0100230_002990 [Opitutaceae bacterium TAV3]